MSRTFFYRITAADFLAAVVTVPEADRAAWVLSLALDMVTADVDTAKSQFAINIINEAAEFSGKKREAANKRWSKVQKQKDTPDMQMDALHSTAMPEAVTEAVTVTEQPLNLCERDFIISQHKRIFARPISPAEFAKFGYLMQFPEDKVEKAFTAAKGKKSLNYVISILENDKPDKPKKGRLRK